MSQTDLTNMINKLVEEKTFGLDALPAVQKLRDKATELENANSLLLKQLADSVSERTLLTNKLTDTRSTITEWIQRNAELENRERKVTELEKNTAVAAAQSSVLSHVLDAMLKNTIIRESITKQVPVSNTSGTGPNGSSTYTTHEMKPSSETITRTEE